MTCIAGCSPLPARAGRHHATNGRRGDAVTCYVSTMLAWRRLDHEAAIDTYLRCRRRELNRGAGELHAVWSTGVRRELEPTSTPRLATSAGALRDDHLGWWVWRAAGPAATALTKSAATCRPGACPRGAGPRRRTSPAVAWAGTSIRARVRAAEHQHLRTEAGWIPGRHRQVGLRSTAASSASASKPWPTNFRFFRRFAHGESRLGLYAARRRRAAQPGAERKGHFPIRRIG